MSDGSEGSEVASSDETSGETGGVDTGDETGTATSDETGSADTGNAEGPRLPVDCAELPDAPECARPIWIEPGTIGDGPPFDNYGFPELGGGFLDAANDRIVISAQFGTDTVNPTGAIATVDLDTGDRVFVTGSFMGPQGLEEFGDGAPIDYFRDVKAGADGWYAVGTRVMAEGRTAVVVRIDPSTGHRELVWDALTTPCVDEAGLPLTPGAHALALAPDGRVLLNISMNPLGAGYGLVAVSDAGCEVVCRTGGDGPDIGAGPPLTDSFYGMDTGAGLVWGIDWLSSSLASIDPTTGDRVRVSNAGEFAVGRGPELGNQSVAYAGNVIYTYSGVLVEVDPPTGNRTDVPMIDGPLAFAQTNGKVIPHANPTWVIVLSELAVTVLDKQTGNSNILSY